MPVDPITLEIVWSKLLSTVMEMSTVVSKTSYSVIVREMRDFVTGITNREGRSVAHHVDEPGLMGAINLVGPKLVEKFGSDINEGDIFITNHPHEANNGHCFDIFIARPVFYDGELICFTAVDAHHTDMGGVGHKVTEDVYGEGLLIPLLKLYDAGKRNETLFKMIAANVRQPNMNFGDINAEIAATATGATRVKELLDKYGKQTVVRCFDEILNHSERLAREEIRQMKQGKATFEDYVDDDETGRNRPIKVRVTLEIKGDKAIVDLTGSDPAGRSLQNSSYAFTCSAVYYGITALRKGEIRQNDGCYRPITIIAPEGTVIHSRPPTNVRSVNIMHRIADCILGAYAKIDPENCTAGNQSQSTSISVRGFHNGKFFHFYDNANWGGLGARPKKDGLSATATDVSNTFPPPIEAEEQLFPIRYTRFEYRVDSGGPGEYRGGLGTIREFELLADHAYLASLSDRTKYAPWGILGGKPGARGAVVMNPGKKDERSFHASQFLVLEKGDIMSYMSPGGGGYGPPSERDPELVLRDVKWGVVSLESALKDYKVAIDPETFVIDYSKTNSLRRTTKASGSVPDV